MHENELDVGAALVRRLLSAQFPHWAGLRLRHFSSSGTDNAIFRLGDELAVRLPRIGWAAHQPEREHRWLPVLAPHLPLAVPVPLGLGVPGEGYPWHWLVVPWMAGEDAAREHLGDLVQAARDVAAFIRALQSIDASRAPAAGPGNFHRGVPLAERDEGVRRAIAASGDMVDAEAVTAAWEEALAAPAWDGPPAWLHGDLLPGNLLARDGRVSSVIDFGCLGAGDPAAELPIAWSLFSGESRWAFRDALGVDDATWARGRGWALTSIGALPYYRDTNPSIVARARNQIAEVLADR
jgi:aminoglycoside phosphotransferase (APT) family kinase protein